MTDLGRAIAASAVGGVAAAGPDTAVRRYLFPPGFPGFSGHFPGDPILPAIVQLMVAVALAGERAGTPLALSGVPAAKFLSPIRPNEEVEIRCRLSAEDGKILCDASLTAAGRPAASFQLHLVTAKETA